MALPVQITFHGLPASPALSDYVQKKTEKLSRLHDRVTHLRVAIEAPHKHSRLGSAFRVRIEIGVPREDLVVSRHHDDAAQNDAYAAVDVAFDDAERELREHSALVRDQVRPHVHAKHGTVSKLFSYEDYGFLQTEEGAEIYFHRNSVENHGFERMRVGSRVRFTETDTDDGGHASHVVLLRAGKKTATPTEET